MKERQEHFWVPTFKLEELLNTEETRDIKKTQLVSSTISMPMGWYSHQCAFLLILFFLVCLLTFSPLLQPVFIGKINLSCPSVFY